MKPRQRQVVCWLTVVVVTSVVRLTVIPHRQVFSHDEAISQLAAAGNQAKYRRIIEAKEPPYGIWTCAREWQTLLEAREWLSFRDAAHQLAHNDIHPPLYFWLLNTSSRLIGSSLHDGLMLNVVFDVMTALLIFQLALATGLPHGWAVFAGTIWALSPATVICGLNLRQYSLFALIASAFVLQWLDARDQSSVVPIVLLSGIAFIGMLTHYLFPIVIVAALVAECIVDHDCTFRRLKGRALATGGGTMLSFWANPWYNQAFSRADQQGQSFDTGLLLSRIKITGYNSVRFFAEHPVLILAAAALTAGAVVLLILKRTWVKQHWTDLPKNARFIGTAGLLIWTALALLYLAFISPHHAMGPRYLSIVWPFVAVMIAIEFARLHSRRFHAILLSMVLATNTIFAVYRIHIQEEGARSTLAASPGRVIVDNPARGVALPALAAMRPTTLVLVASQSDLLSHPSTWTQHVGQEALLLTSTAYENSPDGQEKLIDAMGRHGIVVRAKKHHVIPGFAVFNLSDSEHN